MAWIESHQGLLHHPKTRRLTILMDWSQWETVGRLQSFWWWCMEYAEDGDLRNFEISEIGEAAGVPAELSQQFVDAMKATDWLDTSPYLRVHNWWRYAGPFLRSRHRQQPAVWKRVKQLYRDVGNTSDATSRAPGKTRRKPKTKQSQRKTKPRRTVTPNQTKPDLTTSHHIRQNHHQHQQHDVDDVSPELHFTNPGRHQQLSSTNHPTTDGPVADHAGSGSVAHSGESTRPEDVVLITPEHELEQIISDRISRNTMLSRLDLLKMQILKNKHGSKFDDACNMLHGGITNPLAYLRAILEPKSTTEILAAKLRQFVFSQHNSPYTALEGTYG